LTKIIDGDQYKTYFSVPDSYKYEFFLRVDFTGIYVVCNLLPIKAFTSFFIVYKREGMVAFPFILYKNTGYRHAMVRPGALCKAYPKFRDPDPGPGPGPGPER
jgi:hypothetical protein